MISSFEQGYLVYSNTTTAKRPGVMIVSDWDGISNYEKWRAYLLATQGYVGRENSYFPHYFQTCEHKTIQPLGFIYVPACGKTGTSPHILYLMQT